MWPQTLEIQIKDLAQNTQTIFPWKSIDLNSPVLQTAHTDAPESYHPHRPVWELQETQQMAGCTHLHVGLDCMSGSAVEERDEEHHQIDGQYVN